MPIGRLLSSTRLFEYELGQPVGEGTPGKCSLDACVPELLGWDREAKFQKPHVGRGIALIDMPAAQHAFIGISAIAPLESPKPLRQTILRRAVIKIQTFFPCTTAQIELHEAIRADHGIGHRVKAVVRGDFVEPNPETRRTPRSKRLGQYATPTHSWRANEHPCFPPQAKPTASTEQLRQQRHPIIAQSQITHPAIENNGEFSIPRQIKDLVAPQEIAIVDDRLVKDREVPIKLIKREFPFAPDH